MMVGAMLCIAALSTTFAQEKKCCHKKAMNSKKEVVKCKEAKCEKKCCIMTTEMLEKKKCKEGCTKPCCKKTKVKVNRIDMARVAVDGKLTEKKFMDIHPSKIASKRVLSPKEAVKKYGDMGKHGVVEITLKK